MSEEFIGTYDSSQINWSMKDCDFYSDSFEINRTEDENDIYKKLGISEGYNLILYCHKKNRSLFNYSYSREPTDINKDNCYINLEKDSYRRFLKRIAIIVKDEVKIESAEFYTIDNKYSYSARYSTKIVFGTGNNPIQMIAEFNEIEKVFDTIIDDNMKVTVNGVEVNQSSRLLYDILHITRSTKNVAFDLDLNDVRTIRNSCTKTNNINAVLKCIFIDKKYTVNDMKPAGINKVYTKLMPMYDKLSVANALQTAIYRSFVNNSSRTIDSVKVSSAYNDYFKEVETYEQFEKKMEELQGFYESLTQEWVRDIFEKILMQIPGVQEKRKVTLKSKATGAFNRMMADKDFIDIDPTKHPLTYEAINDGTLALSVFFRNMKEDTYFLLNDNWDLWEEMLEKYRDIAISLANEVKGRTTYEKDLMSYFEFTLHSLPDYLEAHTGKKWTGIPKMVNSSNELEPPKEGENGVAKSRSALTPIVDNENCTITVPYVSIYVGGSYGSTYCYGHNYVVLRKGFSYEGYAVSKDVETKLNGRDDYGLMYYTLTGSSQGRGYPSFLIIFERLDGDTRVHFHRSHPMRSKNGDYNPVHQWTKGCYKWMIGNISYDSIKVQQGDLAFCETQNDFSKKEFVEVNEFDKHSFAEPVKFSPYAGADTNNIIGYFQIEKDTTLNHPEHRQRIVPAGNYELRQCRSWEANPKGIWTLRID